MLKLEEVKNVYVEPTSPPKLSRYVDERETTFARPNPQVLDVQRRISNIKQPQLDNLRNKAQYMENEIAQMRRLAEYKRAQLAATSGPTMLTLPSYTHSSP
jgi:glucan phosphorylase